MKTESKYRQWAFIIRREFLAVSTRPAVLLVLMGGIFLYGLLYNYMYAPNKVTDMPVAVVDCSHSQLSRNYIRWLEATPQMEVYGLAGDFLEAREWMKEARVQGIVYLPRDFEQRVYRGEEAVFPQYATTAAFLYFEALQGASSRVMLALSEECRKGVLPLLPLLPLQGQVAVMIARPVRVEGTALYNFTEGYGSYLIPAVMMVILFQTLLMVIGMLTGEECFSGSIRLYTPFGSGWKAAGRVVLGKMLVYGSLYAVFSLFLLGLLPHFFSIPHIGNGGDIALMIVPFLMSTSFLGLTASRYFTDAEAPLLLIAFFSVGLIFLSGISYPLELMPWYWRAMHYLLPAAPGTLAFVKLNSMGASLADIRPEFTALWVQTLVYFLTSVWVYRQKLKCVSAKVEKCIGRN